MSIFLLTHIGLGDLIMCNGLIRWYCAQKESIYIATKGCNLASVSFMFRDLKNLKILPKPINSVPEFKTEIQQFCADNNIELIDAMFWPPDHITDTVDNLFYKMSGVDPSIRYDWFFLPRDSHRERNLFQRYNVKEMEYAFVHETSAVGRLDIDRKHVNLPIVIPDEKLTDNIFDYGYLIENAAEVHCCESSFKNLSEHLEPKGKLFFHVNRCNGNLFRYSGVRRGWTMIHYEGRL